MTKSESMLARARKTICGGADSSMRVLSYHLPLTVEWSLGAAFRDADGKEYIDMNMGYGPLLFGHRPPFLVAALFEELERRGTVTGIPHELSHLAGELIREAFPSMEKMRFTSSGTEAVQTAVRLARAFTGRKALILFEGHYHGSSDSVFHKCHPREQELGRAWSRPAIPGTEGLGGAPFDLHVLPWNDAPLLRETLRRKGGEVAAVIMEPVMGNAGVILPETGFLEAARQACDEARALLIFDEVISGFRVARGGAQELHGVRSDITVISKAMCGGLPCAAVGGRSDVFDLIGAFRVFHGGVYSGNPLSLAAVLATQMKIAREHGSIYPGLRRGTSRLREGIEGIFGRKGIAVRCQNEGPMLSLWFVRDSSPDRFRSYADVLGNADAGVYIRFQHKMQERGVYFHPNHYEPWFLSTAHSDPVIDQVLENVERAAAEL